MGGKRATIVINHEPKTMVSPKTLPRDESYVYSSPYLKNIFTRHLQKIHAEALERSVLTLAAIK